ncbi:MAG: HD domain-containing protein [Candidatus Pacearchaeota archaeon]
MKIKDRVYGEEEINEPVLVELMGSSSLQRLKGVSQFGMPKDYYHLDEVFSRYEHSLGTLILLRRLGANLEEQVAGLLHDVSHTAFSHVIDQMVGDPSKENYQDEILEEFIKKSELAEILEKYGFKSKKIADIESFSLLERPAPELCADRVDYSLREISLLHSEKDAKDLYECLRNFNQKIVFCSQISAEKFAKYYIHLNKNHWAGYEARARYHILSEILRKSIEEGIISFEGVSNSTDMQILDVLEEKSSREIKGKLEMLKNGFNIISKKDISNHESVKLIKKFRHVDPGFVQKGNLFCLSEKSKEYEDLLEKEREETEADHEVVLQ